MKYTYEIPCVRIREDGSKEDCIARFDGTQITSETFYEALVKAIDELPELLKVTWEIHDDHDGQRALFYVATLVAGVARDKLFEIVKRASRAIEAVAYRFHPDLFAYSSFKTEGEI